VDGESLGDIALYQHKVATKLEGHRAGRPAWADDLLEDVLEAIDFSSMQSAARLQNVHCVTDAYHIHPVPLTRARNGVAAGAVPPGNQRTIVIQQYKLLFSGFPATRGALKAMPVAALRQLVAHYQPGPGTESKVDVLRRLCVLFGMPL
jgi:hypothetical protein